MIADRGEGTGTVENSTDTRNVQGSIDEARIWNVPLTLSHINQFLTIPVSANEPGLPVTLFEAYDENEEAQYVAREVKRLTGGRG